MVTRRASRKASSTSVWLYSRWVVLNALTGAAAIGIPVLAAWAFNTRFTVTPPHSALIVVGIVAAIIGIALSGIFVGSAQWWLVRHRIVGLPLGKWNAALTLGFALSWIGLIGGLAYLQLASVTPWRITNGVAPPTAWVLCTGLLIGLTIALPQALVLRQYVDQAFWWLYSNALGWMFGLMALVAVFPHVPIKGTKAIVGAIGGGSLLLALIVAAVNGLFLSIMLSVIRNTGLRPSDHDMYPIKPRRRRAKSGQRSTGSGQHKPHPTVTRPAPARPAPAQPVLTPKLGLVTTPAVAPPQFAPASAPRTLHISDSTSARMMQPGGLSAAAGL